MGPCAICRQPYVHYPLDCPAGMVPIAEIQRLELYRRGNPFESQPPSPLSSSPSSSDEELYSHALTLHTPMEPVQTTTRRPAPPPPRTKPVEREETS